MSMVLRARLSDVQGMHFVATTASGHTVEMDAAPDHGGSDRAARPVELPVVGLAGCTGMDVVSILRRMRQEATRFEVEVEGKRADEHPRRWLELTVIFHVEGRVEQEKLVRAIELSRTRYCSVAATLAPGVALHYRCVLNGEATDLPDALVGA